MEPFDHVLEAALLRALPPRGRLDLDFQAAAVGQDAGQVGLAGDAEADRPLAKPGYAGIGPPDAQARQRAEGAEDVVLDGLFGRHQPPSSARIALCS